MQKNAIITCGIFLYNLRDQKLLVCHATNSPWKNWSIPKGLREENESHLSAAVRELNEETGIDLDTLAVYDVFSLGQVNYTKQHKTLDAFLVIVNNDLSGHRFSCHSLTQKGTPENDAWKWISLAKAPAYLHETQQQLLAQIRLLVKHV